MKFSKVDMGKRIEDLRKEKGLTITELANEIGITRSALGNIEHGRKGASYEVAISICDYFNVSLDYLVGRNHDKFDKKNYT